MNVRIQKLYLSSRTWNFSYLCRSQRSSSPPTFAMKFLHLVVSAVLLSTSIVSACSNLGGFCDIFTHCCGTLKCSNTDISRGVRILFIFHRLLYAKAYDVKGMRLCQARRIMQWWLWLPSSRLLSRPSMWSTSGKQTSWLDQSHLLTNPEHRRQMYYSAQWIGII